MDDSAYDDLAPASPADTIESLARTVKVTIMHVVSLSFISTLVAVWLLIYTFQPSFMFSDDDYLTSVGNAGVDGDGTESGDHKVFSDEGRAHCLLWSFLISASVAIAVWAYMRFMN